MFEENFGVYGVRKVWRQMLRDGTTIARCTVSRLIVDRHRIGTLLGSDRRLTGPH